MKLILREDVIIVNELLDENSKLIDKLEEQLKEIGDSL